MFLALSRLVLTSFFVLRSGRVYSGRLSRQRLRIGARNQPQHCRFDRNAILLQGDAKVIHVLPLLTDWELDSIIDDTLQKARALGEAVALLQQLFQGVRLDGQRLVPPLQRALELRDVVQRDLPRVVPRQRLE